jgi:D-alanyl-D-alanine dipeptidase
MFVSCKENKEKSHFTSPDLDKEKTVSPKPKSDTKKEVTPPKVEKKVVTPRKTESKTPAGWSELTTFDSMLIDIKYAQKDNFTKKKIYDCGRCFLRPEAKEALKRINSALYKTHKLRLKIFDCFRPVPYQQRLWDAVPDPDYVTPPQKGSMHSRGLAVDLTLIDENDREVDMGTPYDYFGEEAHQDFDGHSQKVKKNREILKSHMEKFGFKSIRTEWWHYSYRSKSYPLDSWVWTCL